MKICFVMNLPIPPQAVGGSELQCYLIAKGLVAKGWDMSYVVGFGGDRQEVSGTRIGFPVFQVPYSARRHARYMRALAHMLLFRILRQVNPDILLVAYGGYVLGVGALYSRLCGKRLVYRAASIVDADLAFKKYADLRDYGFLGWRFHAFSVRSADVIVTNAEWVADAFRSHLPRKTVRVIPNGLEIEPPETREASHVLWLARMYKVKNPAMYVKLAKELPDIQFVMSGSGPLHQQIAKEASEVPNLLLTGVVSGEEKKKLLGSAFTLVNTSLAEGFPNTLIEAGMNRVPYISFVDPDEVICRYELGYHVRSFQELVEKTALLVRDGELRAKMGSNNRHYVEMNHDIEKTVSEYDHLLRSLL